MGNSSAPSAVPTFSLKGCDSFEPMQAMGKYPVSIPILFKDGPFSKWAIYKKWDMDLVRETIPERVELEAFDKSDFIYRNTGPSKMGARFDDVPRWKKVNASGQAFVETVVSDYQNGGRATGSVLGGMLWKSEEIPRYSRVVGDATVGSVNHWKQITDDFFLVDTKFNEIWTKELHGRRTGLAMNVASTNVTTTSHMDLMDNYFTVTYGAKLFVMSPPSAMPLYKFYPIHHTYHRRGQHRSPPKNAPVTVSTVMPGTFLYIPHGWLHRVTATSPTVHFAMFAPLENEKVFDESIAQMVDHVRIVRESITEQAKENALSLFAVFLHQLLVNIVRQTIRTSPEVKLHFKSPREYFKYHAHEVYSKRVRLDLTIPPVPQVLECPAPDFKSSTGESIFDSAKSSTAELLNKMQKLVPQYLRFYNLLKIVDNLLPLMAPGPIPSKEEIYSQLDIASGDKLHIGIGFLACLAEKVR